MERRMMNLWVYILPIPVFALMYWLWSQRVNDRFFVAHVMLLPLVYGYVVPGIGTNLLKKWRFRGPMLVGNYYLHHGFMYAANMSALLYVAFGALPENGPITLWQASAVVIGAAALHGFVLWIHDIYLVRLGMVEIFNRPAKAGKSPEQIVFHYAPLCFFLIGLTYAISAVLAREILVTRSQSTMVNFCWLFLIGIVLTFSLPSLAYRLVDRERSEAPD